MNPQQNIPPDDNPDAASLQPQVFGPQQTATPPAPAPSPQSSAPEPEASLHTPIPDLASSPNSLQNNTPPAAPSGPQVFGPQQTSSFSPMPEQQNVAGPLAPAPNVGNSVPPQAPKRKLPGKKLLVGVAAVLLLGLGGSAFAYVNIMNNSPEKVLADALANTMKDVFDKKPLHLMSNIKVKSSEAGMPLELTVNMDAKQVSKAGEVTTDVRVQAGPQIDVTVSGSVVVQGDEAIYVRLNDLQKTVRQVEQLDPSIPSMTAGFKPLIQKIDGKWIKIDDKSLAAYGFVQSEEKFDKCAESFGNLRISDSDKKRVKEIFKNNQFAIASEELPDETVDGDSSFHYKLDLNEEAAIRFVKDFVELESFSEVKSACEIKQEDIDKEIDNLRKGGDTEEDIKPVIELWVSKKNRYPTKVKITADEKEASMEWTTNTKINAQNISVEIPSDAMSLQELQKEIDSAVRASTSQGMTRGWSAWRE